MTQAASFTRTAPTSRAPSQSRATSHRPSATCTRRCSPSTSAASTSVAFGTRGVPISFTFEVGPHPCHHSASLLTLMAGSLAGVAIVREELKQLGFEMSNSNLQELVSIVFSASNPSSPLILSPVTVPSRPRPFPRHGPARLQDCLQGKAVRVVRSTSGSTRARADPRRAFRLKAGQVITIEPG